MEQGFTLNTDLSIAKPILLAEFLARVKYCLFISVSTNFFCLGLAMTILHSKPLRALGCLLQNPTNVFKEIVLASNPN